MRSVIYAFVKLFDKESHAKDFMSGKLCMNTIGSFKEYQDEKGELRGDSHEGVIAIYQPEKFGSLKLGDMNIPSKDFAAPIIIHGRRLLTHNVFCIYSLNSRGLDEVSDYTVDDLRRTVELHHSCFGLGSYCVVVTKAQEFINRVKAALENLNVHANMGLVEYYDEGKYHGNFPENMLGFHKRALFSHQREYRVRINFEKKEGARYFLDVGDLTDITQLTTPQEFNQKLEVKRGSSSA